MNTKFLIELIEKNTRVILPEFGAFLVKDDGTGTYKNANVTFSPFLRYNDGMVEDALASAKKISKENARLLLNTYIEEIKSKLLEDNKLIIENFGVFNLDKRGSVHFTPIEIASTLENEEIEKPSAIKAKTEEKPTKPETPKVEKLSKPDAPKPEEPKEPKEPKEPIGKIVSTDHKQDKAESIPENIEPKPKKEEKEPSKRATPSQPEKPKPYQPSTIKQKPVKQNTTGTGKAILIGTLIGLGLVIIVAGGWYLYNTGILDFSKKEAEIISTTSNQEAKDSEETTTEEIIAEETAETQGKFDNEFEKLSEEMDKIALTDEESDIKKATENKRIINSDIDQDNKIDIPYPQEGMFHIIAGSFRNANYAEKFSSDMLSAGFKSRVINQPSGMHAVTLGSFLTRQEAADSMNVWKMKYPNVWLLKQ